MKLNLQQFAGSLTVTVYKDAGMTTASASPASSLAKNDTVTLTLTPASGYEVDEVEVVQGGVTVDMETKTFKMGETDVVLNVKSKGSAMYKIVENTPYSVNGAGGSVTRNMTLVKGKNGQIIDVNSTPTDLSSLSADVLAALVESGAAVKV